MKKHLLISCVIALTATGSFAQMSYNYGSALAAAIKFFDANRCGPNAGTGNEFSWRGACHIGDKIPGGYHDAGDHVKFGLPQCWAAATMAWAYYEFPSAFAPVKGKFFRMMKWFTDYFLACHTAPGTFYYHFGDGNADHSYWGPPESQGGGARKAIAAPPGSDVSAQAAAALALMSMIYKSEDAAYAAKCLTAAKSLYALALANMGSKATARCSDGSGGNFYRSSSHWDDMAWGAIWLYTATGDSKLLDPIEEWTKIPNDPGDNHYQKRWSPAWDDVILFVLVKMAEITGKKTYADGVIWNLEWCRDVCKKSPAGLPIIDMWGPLRYASVEAGLGWMAYKLLGYDGFNAKGHFIIDYCLGKNPEDRSYLTGWGKNPAAHPHHRANEPSKGGAVKGIVGALVGGPTDDKYNDDVGNFFETEVALDYNAAFILGLAGHMYVKGGGKAKNRAPSVAITSPLNGVAVPTGAAINFKVVAEDADGKVVKIDLFNGTTLVKSGAASPLIYTWANSGSGEATFHATAVDDSGNVGKSQQVTVNVTAPCTPGQAHNRLGWVVTASKTSVNADEALPNALDGNAATRWASGAAMEKGMWFQLDMGFPRGFDQIVLDSKGSGTDYPTKYMVYATNDPANLGTPVASGEAGPTTTIAIPSAPTAQYIRIVVDEGRGGSWWSIHEINVRCAASTKTQFPLADRNKLLFWIDKEVRNGNILVNYQVPKAGQVSIEEYDLNGSRLRVLTDSFQEAGYHQFTYPANPFGSKLVLLKMNYNGHSQMKKVVFLR